MKSVRLAFCLTLAASTSALSQQPDPKSPVFTSRDAYWSAAFLAASIGLSTADVRMTAWFNNGAHRSENRDRLARGVAKIQEGTLTVGNLAIWGVARLVGASNVADVAWHAAESVVVGSLTSQVVRVPLSRSRPHVTNYQDPYDFAPFRGLGDFRYRAFPSIHTASAFGVATVYTLETQRRAPGLTWIVAPVTYVLALGPGVSRMYTGQHWASDILSGAFVGTLAGVVVMRYNHDVQPDNPLNRLFLGKEGVQVSATAQSLQLSYNRRF